MMLLGLILLVALLIPTIALVSDGPIGRALARRLEGPQNVPPPLQELAKRVELLEQEVDDLNRTVLALQEENTFLRRLREESPHRAPLPPPSQP